MSSAPGGPVNKVQENVIHRIPKEVEECGIIHSAHLETQVDIKVRVTATLRRVSNIHCGE